MNEEYLKRALNFNECKKKGIEKIRTCFYRSCGQPYINSHILQKNGILSFITSNQHVWAWDINLFYDPKFRFKRNGINQAFRLIVFAITMMMSFLNELKVLKLISVITNLAYYSPLGPF